MTTPMIARSSQTLSDGVSAILVEGEWLDIGCVETIPDAGAGASDAAAAATGSEAEAGAGGG